MLFSTKLIILEFQAYENGYVMPNQYHPDLLSPPLSLSAHLRFGCLSVRKFYWSIHDKFEEVPVLLNIYELKEMIIELSKFWGGFLVLYICITKISSIESIHLYYR